MFKPNLKLLFTTALCMLLCGCSAQNEGSESNVDSTIIETITTLTEADHSLTRWYTISETFADIHASDLDITFPVPMTELNEGGTLEGCTFSEDKLIFPDGSYVEAHYQDSGNQVYIINYINAHEKTAPADFTVCGLTFGMTESDVNSEFGIPDAVQSNSETSENSFIYYGAGSQVFTINFKNRCVVSFTFQQ